MSERDDIDRGKHEEDTPSDQGEAYRIDLVNEVRQIFLSKNWPIGEQDMEQGGGPFERTLSMVTCLDRKESWLVLRLLERFVRIEFTQYLAEMKKLAVSIISESDSRKIAIVPIRSIKDTLAGRAKSGDMMGIVMRTAFAGTAIQAQAYTDLQAKEIRTSMGQPGFSVVGVDDFIGTGDTAVSFINHFEEIFPGQKSRLVLASIVCLEKSLERIRQLGVGIYCLHRLGRGISDHADWSPEDRKLHLHQMNEIERRIKIGEQFRLGYGKSEGLVKMMRTPNNTLPVFWFNKPYKGIPWPATFPR